MVPQTDRPKNCRWRRENGNCTIVGGFCTAVNGDVCEAVRKAFREGQRNAVLEVVNVCKDIIGETERVHESK